MSDKERIALANAASDCRVICFTGLFWFCTLASLGLAGTALAMQYLVVSAPRWWLTTSTWEISLAFVTLGAVCLLSADQIKPRGKLAGHPHLNFVQTHLIIVWLDLIVSVAQIICWLLAALLVFRWCVTRPFTTPTLGFYSLLVAPSLVNLILITPLYSLRRKSDGRKADKKKKFFETKAAEREENESKSVSDNQKQTKKPTKKENAKTQPVAYYLKRGETIRGPLERAAVLQAAKGRKLMTGDQIANYKDGPWQDVTKEQLQQIRQGNDVEIK